eukprot:CAMPEP_0181256146 /NCGR_PEP_ID=MMETSP1096-20121128/49548_1 /TAXON_ID=156174 ORGANISM="Chrysochromulina ericina, Strain CCMP281" /NCGR_SAMPLE_ID=MMETSP1096 /ASSEMBLY_ACC=CAM_ASM_000453 /LENGTH=61 /DNA_ID=CAMNT_0023354363 /DNA_START=23 /DNA_END=208 /DNA_ORIENTATION=-
MGNPYYHFVHSTLYPETRRMLEERERMRSRAIEPREEATVNETQTVNETPTEEKVAVLVED